MVKNNGMARTSIGRTVIETICEVQFVDENNDVREDTITVYGDYDINSAQNAVRKKLNNNRLIVERVTHRSFYGKMTLEKFAQECEKSNRKEW